MSQEMLWGLTRFEFSHFVEDRDKGFTERDIKLFLMKEDMLSLCAEFTPDMMYPHED